MRRYLAPLSFATIVATAAPAFAETVTVMPGDDLGAALNALRPGDVLELSDGVYETAETLEATLSGTANDPIIIRGAAGTRPVVQTSSTSTPLLSVTGNFAIIRGLELRGGSVAVALQGENLSVDGNLIADSAVGVRCVTCANSNIVGNEITNVSINAFTTASMRAGYIGENWIHDVPGSAGGIVIGGDSWQVTVGDNVLEGIGGTGIDVSYPANNPDAMVGHTVAANWVRGATNGIRTSGDVVIQNNIVSDITNAGIHSTVLGLDIEVEVTIAYNTVVGAATCLRGTDWAISPAANAVVNNALYCGEGTALLFDSGGGEALLSSGNVYEGFADRPGDSVIGALDTDVVDAASGNFYPLAEGLLVDAADVRFTVAEDFNRLPRVAPFDVGAYERTTEMNPEGVPGGGFKFGGDPVPGADAGADAGDAGPPGGDTGPSVNEEGLGTVQNRPGASGAAGGGTGYPERDEGCGSGGDAAFALPFLLLGWRRRRRMLDGRR